MASSPSTIECDYLVIGAGTRGLAFLDALLSENKKLTAVLADERDQPGGLWNDAHHFAKVNQASIWYGVKSRKLETVPYKPGRPLERASKTQVLAYFRAVVEEYVAAGRLRYFPMCTVSSDGKELLSRIDPDGRWKVNVRRKVVDAAVSQLTMPGTVPPPFKVERGVFLSAPKDLNAVRVAHPKYVVIGCGRTGVDTVLWLLERGVAPDRLYWVKPHDFWYIRRESLRPECLVDFDLVHQRCITSDNVEVFNDMIQNMERERVLCRIDPSHEPESFRGAVLGDDDIAMLRRVTNVIRMGRVQEVGVSNLKLERGVVPTGKGTLHINCADNSWNIPTDKAKAALPIFTKDRLTLHLIHEVFTGIMEYSPCISAGLVGALEARLPDDIDGNNKKCTAIHAWPSTTEDWMRSQIVSHSNSSLLYKGQLFSFIVMNRPTYWYYVSPENLRRLFHPSAHSIGDQVIRVVNKVLRKEEQQRVAARAHAAIVASSKTAVSAQTSFPITPLSEKEIKKSSAKKAADDEDEVIEVKFTKAVRPPPTTEAVGRCGAEEISSPPPVPESQQVA